METKDIIKQRRIELGYTLKDISEKVGVGPSTVSRWESGDIANMKRDKIQALATALSLSPNVIMGLNEVPKNGHPIEYYDSETLEMARAIYENPDLRAFMKAAMTTNKEALPTLTKLLYDMKGTNPDG